MELSYQKKNNTLIACIRGELDQHFAKEVKASLDRELTKGYQGLIFDFSQMDFMDSAGIGVIIGRYKDMKAIGGSVSIASPSPQVRRILEISGIERLIPIYGSVRDAAAKM